MDKKKLLNGLSTLLFVVAIVLWFVVDGVIYKGTLVTSSYKMLNLAFGKTEKVLNQDVQVLKFSFMNFLTLILLFVGALLAALRVASKPKKKKGGSKLLGFVLVAVGIVGTVFVLLTKTFALPAIEDGLKEFKLTGGAIVIAVLSGLGGLSGVAADII